MLKKISIIGAGGVGSTLAFHILSRINVGELTLIDIAGTLAEGIALDLEDTRGFLGFSTKITGTKNFSHIKDSDIVVITAGIARRDGMTRLDLLATNAKIAAEISHKIKKYAPFSIIIVVTNPLDLITKIVVKETGFSRGRVIGMGSSLDTSRLINLIYNRTGISARSIEGFVFGLHSKDMVVSRDRIRLKGERLSSFIGADVAKKICESVKMRGAQIVKTLRTRSAIFAPSFSIYMLIDAIIRDAHEIIPVSTVLEGEYGLKGVCMGVPCVIARKGIERIIEVDLEADEKESLKKVTDQFKEAGI